MKRCMTSSSRQHSSPERRGSVAAAIADMRAELQLNQAGFAAKLGIVQSTVANLESGRRKPSPALAYRLAKLSGKPLETFVEAYYAD